jgi:hypothetical protein
MFFIDGSEKSSRSKADYFEVLIAEHIARHYDLGVNFRKEIKELKINVLIFKDGNERIEEQEKKASKTAEKIIKFFKENSVGKIKHVEWIGRLHQSEETLSDVNVNTDEDEVIGISLKSIRIGTGTQKNLGKETVKTYLSIDIEDALDEMWKKIRQELVKNGLKDISVLGKTKVKNAKYKHPIISTLGKKFGLPIQRMAVEQSVKNFNSLPLEKKQEFLRLIYGFKDMRRLLNVYARDNGIDLYWNEKYSEISNSHDLEAQRISDKAYCLKHNGAAVLRVQSSFTNGIGISPFCQRAFLTGL